MTMFYIFELRKIELSNI